MATGFIVAALLIGAHGLHRSQEEPAEKVGHYHTSLNKKHKDLNSHSNKWCHNGHILPSVFILGAQKCASSSLWEDMVEHFHLAPAKALISEGEEEYNRKEPHFFESDANFEKGSEWYTRHFPHCNDLPGNTRTVDGTPNYMSSPDAAKRIKGIYQDRSQDLHFVVIVRDPAKRMEAGYWHFMANHAGGFDQFVEKTEDNARAWINGETESEPWTPNPYHSSLYSKHLREYLKYFRPDQFTLITLQQYSSDPQGTLEFISKRSGIKMSGDAISVARHYNSRDHDEMTTSTKRKLDALFKDSLKDLDSLVKETGIGKRSSVLEEMIWSKETQKNSVKMHLWDTSKPGVEVQRRMMATNQGLYA